MARTIALHAVDNSSILLFSTIYVGSSLEVKASPCEGEEEGALPFCHPIILVSSSVEQGAVNTKVAGSIPALGAIMPCRLSVGRVTLTHQSVVRFHARQP